MAEAVMVAASRSHVIYTPAPITSYIHSALVTQPCQTTTFYTRRANVIKSSSTQQLLFVITTLGMFLIVQCLICYMFAI